MAASGFDSIDVPNQGSTFPAKQTRTHQFWKRVGSDEEMIL